LEIGALTGTVPVLGVAGAGAGAGVGTVVLGFEVPKPYNVPGAGCGVALLPPLPTISISTHCSYGSHGEM
jgi:hypothetical protein